MREIIVMNRKWSYEIKEGKLFLYEYNNEARKYCNYDTIPLDISDNSIKDEFFIENYIKTQRYN